MRKGFVRKGGIKNGVVLDDRWLVRGSGDEVHEGRRDEKTESCLTTAKWFVDLVMRLIRDGGTKTGDVLDHSQVARGSGDEADQGRRDQKKESCWRWGRSWAVDGFSLFFFV